MKSGRVLFLTIVSLLAFAGNSVLCRLALKETAIDPATFTFVRIASGAALLWIVATTRKTSGASQGGWFSAMALFLYAAGFSFAYTQLPAGSGALLLFGAVQATMMIWGLLRGEKLQARAAIGFALALCGLVALSWPGVSTPPLFASFSMLIAGIAWGAYSLRGRSISNPLQATAGNFLRAVPLAILLTALLWSRLNFDRTGILLAIASGAVTSGLGYVIWYAVVPELGAIRASIVQLNVPVIAAVAGIAFLKEMLSMRVSLAAAAILGGVALALVRTSTRKPA